MFLIIIVDIHLTDSNDHTVSFKYTTIIITSRYLKYTIEIDYLMITEFMINIEDNDINIEITEEVKDKLVKLCYEQKFGARPLRRVIQDQIENQLTDLILENDNVTDVIVDVKDEEVKVE